MVQLSKRLQMAADMVTGGNRVADIGCDHAHTSIYLAQHKRAAHIIAMDVNKGPLERAKENISRSGCTELIETRLSDGARELAVDEVDTLLISGIGGALMIRILEDSREVVESVEELVLQPQSEIAKVRYYLHSRGFFIIDEDMLLEDGKYYTVLHAVKGSEHYQSEAEYYFGSILLEQENPVLKDYLTRGIAKYNDIIANIKSREYDKNKKRLIELEMELARMKEALKQFGQEETQMKQVTLTIDGVQKSYDAEDTFLTVSREYADKFEDNIILVKLNGNLRELNAKIARSGNIEFVTTQDISGLKTYTRGIIMVLMKAIYKVIGQEAMKKVSIEHSLGPGYYGEIEMDGELTGELLQKIEAQMREVVEKDLPFEKYTISTRDAIEKFHSYKMFAKEQLFRYRRVSKTNIYSLGGFEDYFFGYMPPSTGMLRYFKLIPYQKGFILQLPTLSDTKNVPEFRPLEKLFAKLQEVNQWEKNVQITSVGELNNAIANGEMSELMLVQEAFQEKNIGKIAEQIATLKNRKFVMIAGPSSSGKTTFSHRLSIQLRTFGLKPHPIAVDDYFVNRENTPLSEDGSYNFECLEAIDVEQFNKDMKALLEGKRVELPSFNFKTGKREYKGNFKQLGADDILVIEGIHGLNDKLSYALPADSKFKIYISALTTLNVDEHNQISTSDGRLIRRMVRDARTRGASASKTISMWKSVRSGEEQYIFPFQESADIMFNSAMIYELAVLKQFAEPILFHIDTSDPSYIEAKRLLKFLDYFVGVSSEEVPKNSILREFIGNSHFNV